MDDQHTPQPRRDSPGAESGADPAVHPEAGLAYAIRVAREAAGLTQGQLANLVGFSREYVSRAERPSKGLASQGLVEAIDRTVGADGELVALRVDLHAQRLNRRAGTPDPQPPSPAADGARRLVLDPSPLDGAGIGAPDIPFCSDAAPEEQAAALRRLQETDQRDGPQNVLPRVMALLERLTSSLESTDGADRGAFLRTATRAAEFAGFLNRDLGSYTECLFWHDRALEFAQRADDGPMQAYVLLRKAQAAYDQRDATRMLDLARAAGRYEPVGPGLRAEILQQRVRGEAMLGAGADDAKRGLEQAAAALSTRDDRGPDEPGGHYNGRLLAFQAALCLTEAGRPVEGAARYREALAVDLPARDHAYFSILMATSLALSGEPDEAASVALPAVGTAVAMSSRRSLAEGHKLLGVLAPWRSRPLVKLLRGSLQPSSSSPTA